MSLSLSVILYIVAAIIFGYEAWKTRSVLALGLCVFALGHCLVGVTFGHTG